ncbi:MAG TPA: peptidase [Cyanobacteria bacterium UBA8803]|nr:peptidase [Cyanobacteria bacterium UBA9273]HBL57070.1 peptidase [Cyanobacteria bacterium UBA8803]
MIRTFRKYHRAIAIATCLPLFLTVITGIGYTIFDEWFEQKNIGRFLIRLHTLEIFHLGRIYPLLNGLALVGLLVTGLSMTGLFKKRPDPKKAE